MLQPLQVRDVSVRYPEEIAELREFLDKAGLKLGTPESLQELTARLGEDRFFRRDLTSHLWVALHAGGQQVRHAELLAMLAVAAVGPHLAAEAADSDAHELLRFVMQVRSSFAGSPALERQPQTRVAASPLMPATFVRSVSSTSEAGPQLDLPQDVEGRRRIAWIGAAVCALGLLLVALFQYHHAAPRSAASAPVVASNEQAALPARSQGQSQAPSTDAQRTGGRYPAARVESHTAPYSHLSETPEDLATGTRARAKPSPSIPMAQGPRAVSPAKPPARAYARGSHATPAAQPDAVAGTGPSYVPKAVAVDSFRTRGAPVSAGTSRQAIVRPTSLGIMAANVTYSPAPAYPVAASTARVQGEVKLEAEVGRDGTVESTRIISGPPLLADAAADAVQHWRYRPYLYEGKPIAMNAQIVMDFQLP